MIMYSNSDLSDDTANVGILLVAIHCPVSPALFMGIPLRSGNDHMKHGYRNPHLHLLQHSFRAIHAMITIISPKISNTSSLPLEI